MDAISLVMTLLAGGFVVWGAYVFHFCRDRRNSSDRRSLPRAGRNGRRSTDQDAAQSRHFEMNAGRARRMLDVMAALTQRRSAP